MYAASNFAVCEGKRSTDAAVQNSACKDTVAAMQQTVHTASTVCTQPQHWCFASPQPSQCGMINADRRTVYPGSATELPCPSLQMAPHLVCIAKAQSTDPPFLLLDSPIPPPYAAPHPQARSGPQVGLEHSIRSRTAGTGSDRGWCWCWCWCWW